MICMTDRFRKEYVLEKIFIKTIRSFGFCCVTMKRWTLVEQCKFVEYIPIYRYMYINVYIRIDKYVLWLHINNNKIWFVLFCCFCWFEQNLFGFLISCFNSQMQLCQKQQNNKIRRINWMFSLLDLLLQEKLRTIYCLFIYLHEKSKYTNTSTMK